MTISLREVAAGHKLEHCSAIITALARLQRSRFLMWLSGGSVEHKVHFFDAKHLATAVKVALDPALQFLRAILEPTQHDALVASLGRIGVARRIVYATDMARWFLNHLTTKVTRAQKLSWDATGAVWQLHDLSGDIPLFTFNPCSVRGSGRLRLSKTMQSHKAWAVQICKGTTADRFKQALEALSSSDAAIEVLDLNKLFDDLTATSA